MIINFFYLFRCLKGEYQCMKQLRNLMSHKPRFTVNESKVENPFINKKFNKFKTPNTTIMTTTKKSTQIINKYKLM